MYRFVQGLGLGYYPNNGESNVEDMEMNWEERFYRGIEACRALKNYKYHVEVSLRVPDTIETLGSYDYQIGKNLGPYI